MSGRDPEPPQTEAVVWGKHVPWCDTRLGPDFEQREGEVIVTIFACLGCLPAEAAR